MHQNSVVIKEQDQIKKAFHDYFVSLLRFSSSNLAGIDWSRFYLDNPPDLSSYSLKRRFEMLFQSSLEQILQIRQVSSIFLLEVLEHYQA